MRKETQGAIPEAYAESVKSRLESLKEEFPMLLMRKGREIVEIPGVLIAFDSKKFQFTMKNCFVLEPDGLFDHGVAVERHFEDALSYIPNFNETKEAEFEQYNKYRQKIDATLEEIKERASRKSFDGLA